jgi:circadian clock protein KaiB
MHEEYVEKNSLNENYIFNLFISGDSILSNRAINNCKSVFEKYLFNRYKLKIIDVIKNPDIAFEENIIILPLLIRKFPKPELRIIGDMSDTHKVLNELDIT